MDIPRGFYFATAEAGFRGRKRKDLVFMGSREQATAAGVFTRNRIAAAPVAVARQMLQESSQFRGILVNVGQANACAGESGERDCREALHYAASRLTLSVEEILPASTGVIGEPLEVKRLKKGVDDLALHSGEDSPLAAARGITTTDTFPKLAWRRLEFREGSVRIMGLAKGAGMICPNMATMLAFVLTDAALTPEQWRESLFAAAENSFNCISVDGDTSTNDCLLGLANGASQIHLSEEEASRFRSELDAVCRELSYLIIQDAEGGSKILSIRVSGALAASEAEAAARAVAHSPLVKTAMHGSDPNWGRIVAALGRSGAQFQAEDLDLDLSGVALLRNGQLVCSDVDGLLAPVMQRQEIRIHAHLGAGDQAYEMLTSDLSPEYVHINADYRT